MSSVQRFFMPIFLLFVTGFLQEVQGSSDPVPVAPVAEPVPVNAAEDACFSEGFKTDPKCKDVVYDASANKSCNVLKCMKDKVKKCIKDDKRREQKLGEVGQTMKKQKCSTGTSSGSFVTIILATVCLGLFTVRYII